MLLDKDIQRGLEDRLYEKRKSAAVELESVIRGYLQEGDRESIRAIIDQLCRDFAYAIHKPNARNGGLIGLAAAAIALGQAEVVQYLDDIVHPVLACFGDQDARVRYYACESMYNISKVAKGEILVYFNELFDALSKLSTDLDTSVQNGADLLNRLIKDIVSEKAATYVSIIHDGPPEVIPAQVNSNDPRMPIIANEPAQQLPTFSLAKFIPLLAERIHAVNGDARTFLVSWIVLLDAIPDLELVSYLPSFLGGLINFLNDPITSVRVDTHGCLDTFLVEIKKITDIKRAIEERNNLTETTITSQLSTNEDGNTSISQNTSGTTRVRRKSSIVSIRSTKQRGKKGKREQHSRKSSAVNAADTQKATANIGSTDEPISATERTKESEPGKEETSVTASREPQTSNEALVDEAEAEADVETDDGDNATEAKELEVRTESDDNRKIGPKAVIDQDDEEDAIEDDDNEAIEDEDDDEENEGLYIPGQDVFIDFEKIIEILISHLDSSVEEIQLVVLNWIDTFLDLSPLSILPYGPRFLSVLLPTMAHDDDKLRKAAERVNKKMLNLILSLPDNEDSEEVKPAEKTKFFISSNNDGDMAPDTLDNDTDKNGKGKLNYSATVNALTLHFLDEKEETRVAALDWLIRLHRKVPKKILAINDGTFPALLKTLSDPSEQVITRDLQLLAQISFNSDDEYFTVFMINLLNLFSTDRRLLETRGNLIIRQLCISLKPERIYWTLADILEREDEDLEFAGIMVQNLSNILITAPELSQLRMRLRSLNNKEGVSFFTALFKSWCHNSSAALSLCLLSQAYEHAFLLLQTIVEFEITVPLLIQIDKLVQLLESPVFTHLRLQLLEPEKYPYLYKCLYGILMLLPQSSAFATLRNRLNSVSSIGYIHVPPPHHLQQRGSFSSSAGGAGGNGGGSATSGGGASSGNGAGSGAGGSGSSSGYVSRYSSSINTNNHNNTPLSFYDVKWPDLMKKFHTVQQKHQDVRNNALSRSFGDMKLQHADSKSSGAGDGAGSGIIGNISGLSPRNTRGIAPKEGSDRPGNTSRGAGGAPSKSAGGAGVTRPPSATPSAASSGAGGAVRQGMRTILSTATGKSKFGRTSGGSGGTNGGRTGVAESNSGNTGFAASKRGSALGRK
ncbi:hypothetical protein D0Z00_002277 [Geotrichum galactomycetum]|uniref:Uncharacterized protein n=1 Tax=Geotrichum galactomycetum TaxID=27317 RepID=A0ACB6V4K6_9ASCO|nr:hypothetical protein D0Z00_002277 [Geotrichum candidum]